MRTRVLALALVAALVSGAVLAQMPARVRDLNETLDGGTQDPLSRTAFVEMGGAVYFQVADGVHGTELWRSDGTAEGTVLVRDVCPGICSSVPQFLTVVGAEIFFMAYDDAHGFELWKSDGTAAGTVLVKDVVPGRDSASPMDLLGFGPTLLFIANRRELWRSDGTEAGTLLVKQFGIPQSWPLPLAQAGGNAFLAIEDVDHGQEIWKTDGTPEGTVLIKDIRPGPQGSLKLWGIGFPGLQNYLALGNRFLFFADQGSGEELWVSDGTEAGTVLVKHLGPETSHLIACCMAELDGQIFFSSKGRLWKTDGSDVNTVMVKEIPPPPGWLGSLQGLTTAGTWVYFSARGVDGYELWKSDGSEQNTVLVKDIQPGAKFGNPLSGFPFSLRASGTGVLFFADDGIAGQEPWKSDGTEAGTLRLADLNPGAAGSHPHGTFMQFERETVAGGRWFFRALDEAGDMEVHVSDGTPAGTSKLKEINSQTSAFQTSVFPSSWSFGLGSGSMADRSGTLFFGARDDSSGEELWKSDGTEAGTSLVADVNPGPSSSKPYEITALGDQVLFGADSGEGRPKLWSSDGTEAGTSLLLDRTPEELAELNGKVFLSASHGSFFNLWRSDGTPAGTSILGSGPAHDLTPAGDLLFYVSSGSLWRTDGSIDGTFQLPSSSHPLSPTRWGDRIFFANDASLYASDGTAAGTGAVKTFDPGSGIQPSLFPYVGDRLAPAGGKLFLLVSEPSTGEELWMSDGTAAGTVPVRDVFPGPRSSEISSLTGTGNLAYFVANDGTHGRELWASDGTASGTRMVIDLIPGEGSSLPEELLPVGRNLVFSAHTPDHGREVWLTDGTAEGTRQLDDVAPGAIPSSPFSFTLSGPWLYFAATDAETGFELYSVPWTEVDGGADFYTVQPCRLLDTRVSGGALTGGVPRTVPVAGSCGIPAEAVSIAVNVTAISPTAAGSLLSLSFGPGQTRANSSLIHLATDGIELLADLPGQVHATLDVYGYFQ